MKATKNKSNYWMVKQEPETYSWDDFVKDGSTDWSGCETIKPETICAQ